MVSDMTAQAPTADGIASAVKRAAPRGLPPVEKWNPPFCGDLDMRIARDGTWFYLGTPIGRRPLVKLFSSILKREGDQYFLVTPVEKVGIVVDDAPFVAIDFSVDEAADQQVLTFTTHVDDEVIASAKHPIRVVRDPETGEPSPYILVRRNLEALIDRKSFYRLVELGETHDVEGTDWFGIWSSGEFFPFVPAAELQ
ncbi:hypothetical protein POI8812_03370 [Pontivivens insulae]|uniref:Proteophosphoglycan n=2 Tax=Pontivivens insulae TaxID=1639689 RepID=A0A2R8AG26_9RHOB|nr:hypothetical protein DFR53_2980 [Pontivivens insulae]SPF31020.1 hypothetical protein POI8812_03370 [Pontivivens insulae]